MGVAGGQARRVSDGAVNVLDASAAGAHRVMVVVIHAGLVAGGGVRRFDPAQHARFREVGEDNVDGLEADVRKGGPHNSCDFIRTCVR